MDNLSVHIIRFILKCYYHAGIITLFWYMKLFLLFSIAKHEYRRYAASSIYIDNKVAFHIKREAGKLKRIKQNG